MRALTFVITILLLIGPAAAADVQWQTLSDPSGAFTVSLPGNPAVQSKQIPTAAGPISTTTYIVDLGAVAIIVSDSDFSGTQGDPQKVLEGSVGGLKNGRTLLSESEDKLDGVDGRFLKLEKDSTVLSVRVYFVNNHLYQVITAAPPKPTAEQSAIVDRFLGSFHFTKK